jgi:chromate transporter
VIASLALYFALHTLFVTTVPIRLDPLALIITVLALVLIFWRRRSPLRTIGACAALGAIIGAIRLLAG